MTSREIVTTLASAFPTATRVWGTKIAALDSAQFEQIFINVPAEFISDQASRLALRMLCYNKEMIQEVALA